MAKVAELLGQPLMPWQRMVADVGCELITDPATGMTVPAYREIVITVPRQNGKTTLVLSWEMDRVFNWPSPQQVAYTAQTGSAARKKFRDDQAPMIMRSPLRAGVDRVYRAADFTGARFVNGSSITVWANSEDSGHGETIDLGVLDEIFADYDDRREQALIPAMATRADGQKLITSTAGTAASTLLNRKTKTGREHVDQGIREGVAYFEWSADDTDDPSSPETWAKCMPALGYTITDRTVQHAYDTMEPDEFKRAWLNVPNMQIGDHVIDPHLWEQVISGAELDGQIWFGADGTPDRSAGAIVAADKYGRIEVIDHRNGVSWMVDRLVELATKWNAEVALDPGGPLADVHATLVARGVKVPDPDYTVRSMTAACGRFYDAVTDRRLQVRRFAGLDAAVSGASQRYVGDGGWLWGRRSSDVDISPLVAATLAYDRATQIEPPPQVSSFVFA